jgi:hypothetical protein
MPYKVRCTQIENGKYQLSYGKGKLKMTTILERLATNQWRVDGVVNKKKGEAVAHWTLFAEKTYGEGPKATQTPAPPPPRQVAVVDDGPEDPVRLCLPGQPPMKVMSHGLFKQSGGGVHYVVTTPDDKQFVVRMSVNAAHRLVEAYSRFTRMTNES